MNGPFYPKSEEKEARAKVAANLRLIAQQVEKGDIAAITCSFVEQHAKIGQLIWLTDSVSATMLLSAVEIGKFDLLHIYAAAAPRGPAMGLSEVPTGRRYDGTPAPDTHILTAEEYKVCVAQGACIDDDGYGHPMKDGKMCENFILRPSEIEHFPPEATHVAWFNR